jgi:hypothetical protein
MDGRERADLTRPPRRGQVDSRHLVPVHYYSIVSTLELVSVSWNVVLPGRLESRHDKRQEQNSSHNPEKHPTIT